jgi:hypothetical protein
MPRWLRASRGMIGTALTFAAGIGVAARGSVAGDSIPLLVHYTDTDRFSTTFAHDRPTDTWRWHVDNDSSGVRRPLARVALTRRQPGRKQ